MASEQTELLDKALADLASDKHQADYSFGHPEEADAIDLMVAAAAMVQTLPVMPLPDQLRLTADREAFLAQIEQLPAPNGSTAAPSARYAWLSQRLSKPLFHRTEREPRPMFTLLVKAALLLTILFSSMGGTAVLSASTLPDSPIYPIKLMLEETRLSMTNNPTNQTALHLAFAQERAEEMAGLAALDRAPEQAHLANFQAHWRGGLQRAGALPDEQMLTLMEQAQTMASDQETMLAQAQIGATSQVRSRLQEATDNLAQVQTAVSLGLISQNTYRWRMQHLPDGWPGQGEIPPFGPGECEGDCEPNGGFSPGPGYGPGPGAGPGPGEGAGPGAGPGPGEGDGPGAGPGPGEGAGPGAGPGPGEGAGPGPGNDDPGPGNDDPGPGNDDPGPGNDDPGPGNDDPGPGNDDPGPGNDDPGPGNDDPGPGNDDPGPGNDDPGPGNDDPGPGNDDPGPGNDDPGPGNDDPGPGNDDPGPGNDDPGPGNDDPGPGNDDPGPGNDDPGPGNDDPGPGNDDPGPGNDDPGPGNDDPGPGNDDPGSGGGDSGGSGGSGGGSGGGGGDSGGGGGDSGGGGGDSGGGRG